MSVLLATAATAAGTTLMQSLPGIIKSLESKGSGAKSADSLIEFTKSTRNDFLTVIQDDLVALPYMSDITQSVLSIVSGYFLSAVSLAVDVPGIEVVNTLDRLNTQRDPATAIFGSATALAKAVGTESLQYGLPSHSVAIEQFTEATRKRVAVEAGEFDTDNITDPLVRAKIAQIRESVESARRKEGTAADRAEEQRRRDEMYTLKKELDEAKLQAARTQGASSSSLNSLKAQQSKEQMRMQKEQMESGKVGQMLQEELTRLKIEGQLLDNKNRAEKTDEVKVGVGGKDSIATLKELTNLSVGKVFNITFARNGNSLEVPVTISLACTNTDANSMYNVVTFNSKNSSFKERYYRAKAGELSYVKDLLFCQDMIDEARRQRIKDKSGFLENMFRRSRKNFWSGLFSGSPSLNNASSVLIVSEDIVRRAALDLGGKFDKFAIREKIFKNTACMLIVVVDVKWETVRIYHRSLNTFTELSVRELKRASKGNGADVEDILKAYSAGSAPVL